MSGKSEKAIRSAVNLMLLSVPASRLDSARRVFTRKTKQAHHACPGLVHSYLANWSKPEEHPLEAKVQTAVLVGQRAIMVSAVNRRSKMTGEAKGKNTTAAKTSARTLSGV